jgi:hypothetical protein
LAATPSILATDSVVDHPLSVGVFANGRQKPAAKQHALRGLAAERTVYEIP